MLEAPALTEWWQYPGLQAGFDGLTYPVPPDLLLPFGEFIQKYNLSALTQLAFQYNPGYAPFLQIPTLYMFKYLNRLEVESFQKNSGFFYPASGDIRELYDKIQAHFGRDALLNASVLSMDRKSGGTHPVKVRVRTPDGTKVIHACKLVNAAPPMPAVLQNFDLTAHEYALFSQFTSNGYYVGVLNNTGLPRNVDYYSAGKTSTDSVLLPPRNQAT